MYIHVYTQLPSFRKGRGAKVESQRFGGEIEARGSNALSPLDETLFSNYKCTLRTCAMVLSTLLYQHVLCVYMSLQLSVELSGDGLWSLDMTGQWWQRLKEKIQANTRANKVTA